MPDGTENAAFEPQAKAAAGRAQRAVIAIVLVMTALFIGIRAIHLEADPPLWVGTYTRASCTPSRRPRRTRRATTRCSARGI